MKKYISETIYYILYHYQDVHEKKEIVIYRSKYIINKIKNKIIPVLSN